MLCLGCGNERCDCPVPEDADPVAAAFGLGGLAAARPDGDVLAALKAAVEKAEPDERAAAAVAAVKGMAEGVDDAVRLAARALVKEHRLFAGHRVRPDHPA